MVANTDAIPPPQFQGPSSKNPLSFKWYNAEEVILGKKMKVSLSLSLSFVTFQFSEIFIFIDLSNNGNRIGLDLV